MLPHPSCPETNPRQYSPPHSADDLRAELECLEAKLDEAERRIDEAMRPEPVDWVRYYTELFAEAMESGRRRAARMEGEA